MSHVLVVVSRRYNGNELWGALRALRSHQHTFDIVASSRHLEDEVTGQRNKIKLTFDKLRYPVFGVDEGQYDGFMVISGNMDDTEFHWKHPIVQDYVVKAKEADVPIAAICCSVPTIRLAADGKRVSAFPLIRSRHLLEAAGAIINPVSITVDGKLATAEHQMATAPWAEFFCDLLAGLSPNPQYTPVSKDFVLNRLIPRRPIPEIERLALHNTPEQKALE